MLPGRRSDPRQVPCLPACLQVDTEEKSKLAAQKEEEKAEKERLKVGQAGVVPAECLGGRCCCACGGGAAAPAPARESLAAAGRLPPGCATGGEGA